MPAFRRSSSGVEQRARAAPGGLRRRARSARAARAPGTHHRHRGEAQHAGEREQAVHADPAVEHRRADQRQREHEADGRADHRHDLGAMLLAREIGGERHRHRRDRAGALQRARRRSRSRCRRATTPRKLPAANISEPDVEHRLPAPAVGSHAERNLQDALRETVGAERDADQRQVVAAARSARACTANTGRMKNSPSMRRPKTPARLDARAQLRRGLMRSGHSWQESGGGKMRNAL